MSSGYTGCVRFETSATQEGISKNPIRGLDTDICGSLGTQVLTEVPSKKDLIERGKEARRGLEQNIKKPQQ